MPNNYDFKINLKHFNRIDDIISATFNNEQTLIFELPLGDINAAKYNVMLPSLVGMYDFGAKNLNNGEPTTFTKEKWNNLREIVKPHYGSHPIVALEQKAHEVHQAIVEPLGLEEIMLRPWGSMLFTGAITITYPIFVPLGLLAIGITHKLGKDPRGESGLAMGCLIGAPFLFKKHLKEIFSPSKSKYAIINTYLLEKNGTDNTPKLSLCEIDNGKLPRIYLPNGVELIHKGISSKPHFGSYRGCEYYYKVDSSLQKQLFGIVDELEVEREKLLDFSRNL
ncbi:hypothetical protein HYX19_04485, partial [Candidatus Woesearchaeota archaeon]|nr:hypothetical protein [Candidatus Woesearchaeota archaeon]